MLTVSAVPTPVKCTGESNGSIDATVTGGTPTITYSWVGPGAYTANTEDISGLAAGTYTLTVTEASIEPLDSPVHLTGVGTALTVSNWLDCSTVAAVVFTQPYASVTVKV